jgi:hypothetical protein
MPLADPQLGIVRPVAYYESPTRGSPARGGHATSFATLGIADRPTPISAQGWNDASVTMIPASALFDTSSVTAVPEGLAMPAHRSVMPLPTNMSLNVSQPHNVSYTASRSGRSAFGNTSTNTTKRSTRRSGSQQPSSHHQLSKSLHTADAACCAYQHREEHASRADVKGLFVTFCESTLETRMNAAVRDLEVEQQTRHRDNDSNERQLVKMLRSQQQVARERDEAVAALAAGTARHATEMANLTTVRQEYERRFRAEEATASEMAAKLKVIDDAKTEETIQKNNDTHRLETLEKLVEELRGSLERVEKEALQNMHRAQLYHEEKAIVDRECTAAKREMQAMSEALELRNQILRGMEKELGSANEKLSSVTLLRESVRRRAGPTPISHALQRSTSQAMNATKAAEAKTSQRITDRMFARGNMSMM